MKKLISMMLVLLMMTTILPAFAAGETMVGGWTTTETPEIPQDALDALNQALEGLEGAAYEPIALLATQVVAGVNYAFLCRVTPIYPNASGEYCLVYVYAGLDGQATILEAAALEYGLSAVGEAE